MRTREVDYRAMGVRIRARRRALKLTQEKLAERVDVSPSYVGCIERGEKKASLETVVRVGEALDMSLDYIAMGRKVKCGERESALYAGLNALIDAYR